MSLWINNSLADRLAMIQRTTLEKQLPDENAVEKDWWVTLALKALFSLDCHDYLLFKGGTSLSKGWKLINRFSEDIDLCIDREFFGKVKGLPAAECRNNNQIKLLREASRDYVIGEMATKLEQKFSEWELDGCKVIPVTTKPDGSLIDHDSDPTTLLLEYQPVVGRRNVYLPPVVKIEISCLGMREPFEVKPLQSLIGECFPNEDDENIALAATVLPSRTFLEKVFLLNEEFQRKSPRYQRMSRHLYDIERLTDTDFGRQALADKDMYEAIVEHRAKFYHVGGVDYSLDATDKIDFIPTGALLDSYRTDYVQMQHSFIYGQSLDFGTLIEHLIELRTRFRSV